MAPFVLICTLSFIVALVVGFLLCPILIAGALRWGIIDTPDNNLKTHTQPTAYLGGLGVFGAWCAGIYVAGIGISSWHLAGLVGLLTLGLADDIYAFTPRIKIMGHLCVAICFVLGGAVVSLPFLPSWLAIPLTVLWIITVVNAFNLIDVMDGLAATTAWWAAAGFMWCAYLQTDPTIGALYAALMGSIFAFFVFNRPRARMYLGDAGSLFLGGFFAVAPLMMPWAAFRQCGVCAVPAILFIPLIEIVTLVAIRTAHNIPFYNGSRHHFAHFLQNKGWCVWSILCFASGIGIAATVAALAFVHGAVSLPWFFVLGGSASVVWWCLVVW